MANQKALKAQSFDELIEVLGRQELQIRQDWDESKLDAFLLRDYWSPIGGLCLLAGFHYSACDQSSPYQLNWTDTLTPGALQGHSGEDAIKVEELIDSMNCDLDRLRIIWAGSGRDTEAENHEPAYFIEWAISKGFRPKWLDWAIERELYVPKKEEDEASLSHIDQTRLFNPPELAMQLQACAGETVAVSDTPAAESSASASIPWHLLATPAELIAAFGVFTGMNAAWFNNAKDSPQLKAALHTAGQGGRSGRKPLYFVYPVMCWLIDVKRRKGNPIDIASGWRVLKNRFPKVYETYQDLEPD